MFNERPVFKVFCVMGIRDIQKVFCRKGVECLFECKDMADICLLSVKTAVFTIEVQERVYV